MTKNRFGQKWKKTKNCKNVTERRAASFWAVCTDFHLKRTVPDPFRDRKPILSICQFSGTIKKHRPRFCFAFLLLFPNSDSRYRVLVVFKSRKYTKTHNPAAGVSRQAPKRRGGTFFKSHDFLRKFFKTSWFSTWAFLSNFEANPISGTQWWLYS